MPCLRPIAAPTAKAEASSSPTASWSVTMCRKWVHWMQRAGCTAVYGLGESLGASILIEATALEPVFRAAVAESPYSDLPAIAEYRLPTPSLLSKTIVWCGMAYARVRFGLDLWQISPLQAMAQTSTPILLIHGLEDEKTPPWHSQTLAGANHRAVLWLVPHAGHTACGRRGSHRVPAARTRLVCRSPGTFLQYSLAADSLH